MRTGCGGKGMLIHCWWECKWVQPLWKTVWMFLKKLKIELQYDPAVLLLGRYPNDYKSAHNREICTPMFIAILVTIAKLWKQHRSSSTECEIYIYKCVYINICVCVYMYIYAFSHKEGW
jgi:hypothetical protein